jgi:hypothetical protein
MFFFTYMHGILTLGKILDLYMETCYGSTGAYFMVKWAQPLLSMYICPKQTKKKAKSPLVPGVRDQPRRPKYDVSFPHFHLVCNFCSCMAKC